MAELTVAAGHILALRLFDVLQVANTQPPKMGDDDELLDDELPRMYDLVESTRRSHWRGCCGTDDPGPISVVL
jgi:hypothetical protein